MAGVLEAGCLSGGKAGGGGVGKLDVVEDGLQLGGADVFGQARELGVVGGSAGAMGFGEAVFVCVAEGVDKLASRGVAEGRHLGESPGDDLFGFGGGGQASVEVLHSSELPEIGGDEGVEFVLVPGSLRGFEDGVQNFVVNARQFIVEHGVCGIGGGF